MTCGAWYSGANFALNQACGHSQLKAGCGRVPGLLKLVLLKLCVRMSTCRYVCHEQTGFEPQKINFPSINKGCKA